jgi:hypothetical protein
MSDQELRRWALEQAVKIVNPADVTAGWVVRVADVFRAYAEKGTVLR